MRTHLLKIKGQQGFDGEKLHEIINVRQQLSRSFQSGKRQVKPEFHFVKPNTVVEDGQLGGGWGTLQGGHPPKANPRLEPESQTPLRSSAGALSDLERPTSSGVRLIAGEAGASVDGVIDHNPEGINSMLSDADLAKSVDVVLTQNLLGREDDESGYGELEENRTPSRGGGDEASDFGEMGWKLDGPHVTPVLAESTDWLRRTQVPTPAHELLDIAAEDEFVANHSGRIAKPFGDVQITDPSNLDQSSAKYTDYLKSFEKRKTDAAQPKKLLFLFDRNDSARKQNDPSKIETHQTPEAATKYKSSGLKKKRPSSPMKAAKGFVMRPHQLHIQSVEEPRIIAQGLGTVINNQSFRQGMQRPMEPGMTRNTNGCFLSPRTSKNAKTESSYRSSGNRSSRLANKAKLAQKKSAQAPWNLKGQQAPHAQKIQKYEKPPQSTHPGVSQPKPSQIVKQTMLKPSTSSRMSTNGLKSPPLAIQAPKLAKQAPYKALTNQNTQSLQYEKSKGKMEMQLNQIIKSRQIEKAKPKAIGITYRESAKQVRKTGVQVNQGRSKQLTLSYAEHQSPRMNYCNSVISKPVQVPGDGGLLLVKTKQTSVKSAKSEFVAKNMKGAPSGLLQGPAASPAWPLLNPSQGEAAETPQSKYITLHVPKEDQESTMIKPASNQDGAGPRQSPQPAAMKQDDELQMDESYLAFQKQESSSGAVAVDTSSAQKLNQSKSLILFEPKLAENKEDVASQPQSSQSISKPARRLFEMSMVGPSYTSHANLDKSYAANAGRVAQQHPYGDVAGEESDQKNATAGISSANGKPAVNYYESRLMSAAVNLYHKAFSKGPNLDLAAEARTIDLEARSEIHAKKGGRLEDQSFVFVGRSQLNRSAMSRGATSALNQKDQWNPGKSASRLSKQGSHQSLKALHSPAQGARRLLPKSQEYLSNTFCQEFWPIIRAVLQKKSNEDLLRMLDSHDLKYCTAKQKNDAFLFLFNDFKHNSQERHQETKLRLSITDKLSNFRLKVDHAEEILMHLGLIRPSKDNEFDDRFEFMKLWQLLKQLQRERDAREAAEAARRPRRQGPVDDSMLNSSKQSESKEGFQEDNDITIDQYIIPAENIDTDNENEVINKSENQTNDMLAECLQLQPHQLWPHQSLDQANEEQNLKRFAEMQSSEGNKATSSELAQADKLNQNQAFVKVSVLLDALLHLLSIRKQNQKLFNKFKMLRKNRQQFEQDRKKLLSPIKRSQKADLSRLKDIEAAQLRQIQEDRAKMIPQKGYFGSQQYLDMEAGKRMRQQKKMLKQSQAGSSSFKQQQFFSNYLRNYDASAQKSASQLGRGKSEKKSKIPTSTEKISADRKQCITKVHTPRQSITTSDDELQFSPTNLAIQVNRSLGPTSSSQLAARVVSPNLSLRKEALTDIRNPAKMRSRGEDSSLKLAKIKEQMMRSRDAGARTDVMFDVDGMSGQPMLNRIATRGDDHDQVGPRKSSEAPANYLMDLRRKVDGGDLEPKVNEKTRASKIRNQNRRGGKEIGYAEINRKRKELQLVGGSVHSSTNRSGNSRSKLTMQRSQASSQPLSQRHKGSSAAARGHLRSFLSPLSVRLDQMPILNQEDTGVHSILSDSMKEPLKNAKSPPIHLRTPSKNAKHEQMQPIQRMDNDGDTSENLRLDKLRAQRDVANADNHHQADADTFKEYRIDTEEMNERIQEVEHDYLELLHAQRGNDQAASSPPENAMPLYKDLSEIKEDITEHFLVTDNSSAKAILSQAQQTAEVQEFKNELTKEEGMGADSGAKGAGDLEDENILKWVAPTVAFQLYTSEELLQKSQRQDQKSVLQGMAARITNQKSALDDDVIKEAFREDSLNTSDDSLSEPLRVTIGSIGPAKNITIDQERSQDLPTDQIEDQIPPRNSDVDISQLKAEARSFLQRQNKTTVDIGFLLHPSSVGRTKKTKSAKKGAAADAVPLIPGLFKEDDDHEERIEEIKSADGNQSKLQEALRLPAANIPRNKFKSKKAQNNLPPVVEVIEQVQVPQVESLIDLPLLTPHELEFELTNSPISPERLKNQSVRGSQMVPAPQYAHLINVADSSPEHQQAQQIALSQVDPPITPNPPTPVVCNDDPHNLQASSLDNLNSAIDASDPQGYKSCSLSRKRSSRQKGGQPKQNKVIMMPPNLRQNQPQAQRSITSVQKPPFPPLPADYSIDDALWHLPLEASNVGAPPEGLSMAQQHQTHINESADEIRNESYQTCLQTLDDEFGINEETKQENPMATNHQAHGGISLIYHGQDEENEQQYTTICMSSGRKLSATKEADILMTFDEAEGEELMAKKRSHPRVEAAEEVVQSRSMAASDLPLSVGRSNEEPMHGEGHEFSSLCSPQGFQRIKSAFGGRQSQSRYDDCIQDQLQERQSSLKGYGTQQFDRQGPALSPALRPGYGAKVPAAPGKSMNRANRCGTQLEQTRTSRKPDAGLGSGRPLIGPSLLSNNGYPASSATSSERFQFPMSLRSGQTGRTLGQTMQGRGDDRQLSEGAAASSTRLRRPSQRSSGSKTKSNQAQVITFEIHVDSTIGTQEIEIYDRQLISENVERFALKFGIVSKSKINKLKKYIKNQFKQADAAPAIDPVDLYLADKAKLKTFI